MNITSVKTIERMGYTKASLFPVSMGVEGANKGKIHILGGIILEVTATNPNTNVKLSTIQLFYISNQLNQTYLSRDCCEQLQTIPRTFPSIGSCPPLTLASAVGTVRPLSTECTNTGVPTQSDQPCTCPKRTLPPKEKARLPCEPTENNLPIIKKYIMDRYSSSAFNVCEHQPLPLMKGSEPLKLHVDPEATPTAIKTPAQVPLAWHDAVRKGLERDVRLGVLERVPLNTPDTWCSRMHLTPKPDGSPRRVVDYGHLNKHAPRQTHHTQPPWSIAASIPANSVKTVLDCWHGYHSVPIAKEDRHLTTFLTAWGQFRYKTTPQGFISAGDGYTDRTDRIIAKIPNVKKCVDDSILWANDIKENFHQVCQFLDICSNNGIIFNPKKFQFANKTVRYLGFQITDTGIKPTDEFVKNILNFPTPTNITDVRSWFGAVGQINYAFAAAPEMLPFRHLLSTKVPFQWSPDLEEAFQKSKKEIVKLCEAGIRSFNPSLPTALATDWSKLACGLWLCQKHCKCDKTPTRPGCCPNGWQTVFCASKFNNTAQSRQAPIEGEASSVAWAMEKCKFFLLGLPEFTLCVDHLPLINILGNKELCDIPNPRLLRYKEKTLMFRFKPVHVPGKKNVVPDCWSRRHDSPIAQQSPQVQNPNANMDISNITPGYQDHLGPPSWVSSPTTTASLATLQQEMKQGDQIQIQELLAHISDQTDDEDDHSVQDNPGDEILRGRAISSLAYLAAHLRQDLSCNSIHTDDPTAVITWKKLIKAANESPIYQVLYNLLISGAPPDKDSWPEEVQHYFKYRHSLLTIDGVVLFHDRPLIPLALRPAVLDHLHAANAGVTGMYARASSSVWWPNIREDLVALRASCKSCIKNAPSNPAAPPQPITHPAYPFHSVAADFFHAGGHNYLAIVCRYSNWLSLFRLQKDDSQHVIAILREYFTRWGIPVIFTSDGASVFTSLEMRTFLERYGVTHRVASNYYPRANKRAEVGVKSAKRLILENISPSGSLNTDRVARALLIHHNQTDPVSGLSPAEVIFGRRLRDHLPLQEHKFQPRVEWRLEADLREKAYAKRHLLKQEQLSQGARPLPPLAAGDCVAIQDEAKFGKAGKWTKTGIITQVLPFQSYEVKVDGSNKLTRRNRVHLRKIIPFINKIMQEEQQIYSKNPLLLPKPVSHPSPTSLRPPPEASAVTTPSPPPSTAVKPTTPPPRITPPQIPPKPQIKEKVLEPRPPTVTDSNQSPSPLSPVPTFTRPISSSPVSTPPPPGQKHNYSQLARQAQQMRERVLADTGRARSHSRPPSSPAT